MLVLRRPHTIYPLTISKVGEEEKNLYLPQLKAAAESFPPPPNTTPINFDKEKYYKVDMNLIAVSLSSTDYIITGGVDECSRPGRKTQSIPQAWKGVRTCPGTVQYCLRGIPTQSREGSPGSWP